MKRKYWIHFMVFCVCLFLFTSCGANPETQPETIIPSEEILTKPENTLQEIVTPPSLAPSPLPAVTPPIMSDDVGEGVSAYEEDGFVYSKPLELTNKRNCYITPGGAHVYVYYWENHFAQADYDGNNPVTFLDEEHAEEVGF